MKIESTEIYGFGAAIRALRNPLDSWGRSDSWFLHPEEWKIYADNLNAEGFVLGNKDAKLSRNLSKSGSDHRKHLRLVRVWADWTAPRYLWQEIDTYKHIDKVSCSTVHKLMSRHITENDFDGHNIPAAIINKINTYIDLYKNSKYPGEKNDYLLACKNLLPEGFLQKRTISTNYECLLTIYTQRRNHPLPHWGQIRNWITSLPYFIELTGVETDED